MKSFDIIDGFLVNGGLRVHEMSQMNTLLVGGDKILFFLLVE